MGGWQSNLQALVIAFFARGIILYLSGNEIFWANLAFVLVEIGIFAFIYTQKDLFMPSEEERKATMRRLAGPTLKSVAECPKCG